MRILSLHIDAFGKLRDFSLDFDERITAITEDNGYGKTTLAAFIKAMLYGIPDNRDKGKMRKKYAPWSGGDFGGTLDLETERGRYRIARRFAPKTGDSFELLSLDTLLPCEDYGENIGFELFSVDAESYEKSVYLPQHEVDIKMTDTIGARLTQLLEGSNDMLDFSDAIEKIKARRRELELYRGAGGLIEDTKNELSKCEKHVAEFEGKLRDAAVMRNSARELGGEVLRIENDIAVLSEKLREENEKKLVLKDVEIYRGLVSECDVIAHSLAKARKNFAFGIPKNEELAEAEELEREIGFLRRSRAELCQNDTESEESKRLCEMFCDGVPSAYELTKYALDAREIEKKQAEILQDEEALKCLQMPKDCGDGRQKQGKTVKLFAAIAALGVLLLVIGLAALPVLTWIGGAITAMFCSAAACSAILGAKETKARNARIESFESQKHQKELEIEKKRSELQILISALSAELSKYKINREYSAGVDQLLNSAKKYEELQARRKEHSESIARIDAQIKEKENRLTEFLKAYGFVEENEKTPSEICELCERILREERELSDRRARAESFKSEKAIPDELPSSDIDVSKLESAIAAAQKALQAKSAEESRLEERAKRLEEDAETLPSEKDKREALLQSIAEYTERRDIYDKTEKLLEKAKENLSSRYIVDMKNSFAERFSLITDNEREITLDSKLEIKLRDEGGAKKAAEYSTGWQAVISVCLRFALIDALYENERPFIILDDPFVNMDENKIARALDVLRELSKTTQIIYLTCHKSRAF